MALSNLHNNIDIDHVKIRTELRPGDMGYIIYLHGRLYKSEYGYGVSFEAYVASGFYEFYKNYDAEKDAVWIAEHEEKIVGFLLLMHREHEAAQLRYFILDPAYRGIGLGKKLAVMFMDHLKKTGYRTCYLWTTNELSAAAHIYGQMGFRLTEEVASTAFGKPLKEQRYELIVESGG